MNSKKNKSKGRGKPPTKITQEENINKTEDVNSENVSTDETRVPEIVTESINIVENDQSKNDIPKKPKRSKGSKRKEPVFEDIKTKEENDESKDIKDESENIENTKGNISITPCVRKKKKKTKKQDENEKENLEFHVQMISKCSDKDSEKETCVKNETGGSDPVNIQILPENIDVPHKDDTPGKKKKKKKHRQDSEKSDICNPCTMAFQKLIEPSTSTKTDNNDETTEIQQIKADTKDCIELVKQVINSDHVKEEIKSAESSIKKKNKKGKQDLPERRFDIEKFEETSTGDNIKSVSIEPLESGENKIIIKETSPKPKAKIIKPVQNKRRNKSESEPVQTSTDDLENDSSENINKEVSKDVLITIKNESHPYSITKDSYIPEKLSENDDDNIQAAETVQCQSMKPEIHDEFEISNELISVSENKQEQEILSKNYDDLGFVEVKTGKSKKKRNKSAFALDACEKIEVKSLDSVIKKDDQNFNIKCTEDSNDIVSEDLDEPKSTIPDLIEYPRSTSQQHVDSNNNTYIQEMKPTEQVNLDIPVYSSEPIIQGPGVSPEAKARIGPDIITVTEIDQLPSTSKDNIKFIPEEEQTSENIDVKSKMIEVNRDMEELKRSIERSLAELTAGEKCDTEVDKKFEELFQSQTADDISSNKATGKKYDMGLVEKSAKSDEVDKNLQLKEMDNIETSNKDVNKPSVVESLVSDNIKTKSDVEIQNVAPVCPARRDKGKNKSKKKGKKESVTSNSNTSTSANYGIQTASAEKDANQKSENSEQKSKTTQEKGKQQTLGGEKDTELSQNDMSFEPIENFEDALTSSVDDINQTFEIIARDSTEPLNSSQYKNNPQINIISPAGECESEEKQDKNEMKKNENPISRPKNLLGHPNIPASSNKTDFKKEKSKPPNSIQAKVKIKDSVDIEKAANKKSLINNKQKLIKESNKDESTYLMKTNEDLIYKYSFRKVFFPNTCNVCKKNLVHRVPCKFCSLVFYCSQKHKEDDWSKHQSLCFAVCTIAHLKEQKHIYADAQNILGHNYRVLRMQAILSCEKVLNRKLVPWEQEALLYPRLCTDAKCRQWKQGQLKDCAECGQLSYCIDHPEHLPASHQRWCKSYALYQKMVSHQLTKGRLEPPLPTRVLNHYQMPGKLNDVLGSIYEEKIDMDDVQYAALTQIATAPLTAAYSYQLHSSKMNSTCANGTRKNLPFTIHLVGAELPFEADSLNKWETFFLHLRSDIQDLRVVMVGPDINSSKLPLDLLSNIKIQPNGQACVSPQYASYLSAKTGPTDDSSRLCGNCQTNKRHVLFDFHDNENYYDYCLSDGFVTPDIVCAFNPNIHRTSAYNTETWSSTINSILKQRVPFVLTSYSIEELRRDLGKVREYATVDFNVVSEIKYNPFSSVRPDRNFITDHEIPLLFRNYCFCILCGTH